MWFSKPKAPTPEQRAALTKSAQRKIFDNLERTGLGAEICSRSHHARHVPFSRERYKGIRFDPMEATGSATGGFHVSPRLDPSDQRLAAVTLKLYRFKRDGALDEAAQQIWAGVTTEEKDAVIDAALESLVAKQEANKAAAEREFKTYEPGSDDAKAEEYYVRQAKRELFYLNYLRQARRQGTATQALDNAAAILVLPKERATLPEELHEPSEEQELE